MGHRLLSALVLASLCGFPTGARAQEGPAAVALESCRDRAITAVQERYDGVRDVAARFEQTTRTVGVGSAAGPAKTSRGRVVLAKPGRMRWSYESPGKSLVVSDGETLWLYDPEFGEAQKLPAAGGYLSGAAAQFLLGAGDMRRDFAVSAITCETEAVELQLVPREPASYEKLFLEVDAARGDLRATRVVDLLGNVVTVRFEQMRFDTKPPDATFRFDPPEGVRVIEMAP